ncbi:MAG: carboxypeptidase regulatory-like domain-containing protein [Phycisphaerae bacterium]|nr:carboxypeptidase regulatory-like domain-containing protein [Gemmatimonadaceae bacterium]
MRAGSRMQQTALYSTPNFSRIATAVAVAIMWVADCTAQAQIAPTAPAAPVAQPTTRGRITGRVVDVSSGQPLADVMVTVVGRTLQARTDLDGRYTIVSVPTGTVSVLARRLGFQPKQFDNVAVSATEATIVNFSIGNVAVALQSIVVQETRTDRSASQASLLAAQQRAPSASDGVSAEQIRKSPDSNAGEAATRVSGVSIVDGKFLVARGLSERYSTTLLNGAEVPSPEPAKKIVPLDVFPASLLESIVVTKSATPDKPGDFSGGAVEIKTKEFPDNTIRQFSFSQGYNSQGTFKKLPFPHKSGTDFFGIDNGRRAAPLNPKDSSLSTTFGVERFAEAIRNDWAPRPVSTPLNLGLGMTLGGQRPSERAALGYVVSLTYSSGSDFQANRFFQFFADPNSPNRAFVYQDHRNTIDWGGVANVSLRLGQSSKLSWKNLYTRNAEELYSTSEGFSEDRNGDLRQFQFQYIERDLLQTQLVGEHLIPFLGSTRFEWKGTLSESGRDEPDNRQLEYVRTPNDSRYGLGTNSDVWFRTLNDRQYAAQADLLVPMRLFGTSFSLKAGGMMRSKVRAFDGRLVSFNPRSANDIPDDLVYLPPELLFTPENVGSHLGLTFVSTQAQPYDADEKLTAAYGMLDLQISRLRMVAGARMEDWSIDLFDGGRARYAAGDSNLVPILRRNKDILASANATLEITDRINFRVAGFQSVARPDTRELSQDEYIEVAGSCSTIGNSNLKRSTILNADARLEWYPRPGEVISVSGFFKDFKKPIVRVVEGRNGCTNSYENAESARSFGGEFDFRQDLTYLPGPLSGLSIAANFTYVETSVVIAPQFGTYAADLRLEGQSPYVANGSLSYRTRGGGFNATLLYNQFGDRIVRYGFRSSGGVNATQGPNIVERGRGTLDAKLQQAVGKRVTVTLSGRNLTNVKTQFFQDVKAGEVDTAFSTPGYTLQLGASVAR